MTELEDLKEQLGTIALKIESLEEPKKWGEHINLEYQKISQILTTSELKRLIAKQEFLSMSFYYACENDGIQDFAKHKYNWVVCFSHNNNKYISLGFENTEDKEKVYMTEKDASNYCKLLNNGLVAFRYQDE